MKSIKYKKKYLILYFIILLSFINIKYTIVEIKHESIKHIMKIK